jgi:hypothetical protein
VDRSVTLLRPSLKRRIPFFVLAVLLLALMVAGLVYSPIIGAIGVLVLGFAVVNGALRLFHPRSYATELDDDEFRVYDSMGRVVHRVRWTDVEHLTVFHGNGFGGPGTVLHLAWRCLPRQPGPGRQPWSGGGRNFAGEEYDGALPDPYVGIEPMLDLFKERADAAKARR